MGGVRVSSRLIRERSYALGVVAAAVFLAAACGSSSGGNDAAGSASTAALTAGVESAPEEASTSTTVAATTTEPPPPEPIVIAFAGDTSFTNGNDRRDPFAGVEGVLSAPDLMVVNLETAVAAEGVGEPFPKDFVFKSPPESLQLLLDAGVDAVSLANNHTRDYGFDGLSATVDHVGASGLVSFGAAETHEAAYEPAFVDVDGITVGLVGFSRVPCDWSASAPESRPGVAWACPAFADQVDAAVAKMIEGSDISAVMVHGGTEGVRCPSDFMVELMHGWADAGVDLVIGGHPHVVQGVETRGDSWIVWSTGNFAFPSAKGQTADTAIFAFTIERDRTGAIVGRPQLGAFPVRVSSGAVSVAGADDARRILDTMTRYSNGIGFDEGGFAVETDRPSDCG